MPVKVVDASALGAVAFGEPEAEALAAMLSGSLLVAPLLMFPLYRQQNPPVSNCDNLYVIPNYHK